MHHNFDDSESGCDFEDHQKVGGGGRSFGIGGYGNRVIILGDGTEVLTDSDDTEMFDNTEEDKDLVSQVSRGTTATTPSEEGEKKDGDAKTNLAGAGENGAEQSQQQQQ